MNRRDLLKRTIGLFLATRLPFVAEEFEADWKAKFNPNTDLLGLDIEELWANLRPYYRLADGSIRGAPIALLTRDLEKQALFVDAHPWESLTTLSIERMGLTWADGTPIVEEPFCCGPCHLLPAEVIKGTLTLNLRNCSKEALDAQRRLQAGPGFDPSTLRADDLL